MNKASTNIYMRGFLWTRYTFSFYKKLKCFPESLWHFRCYQGCGRKLVSPHPCQCSARLVWWIHSDTLLWSYFDLIANDVKHLLCAKFAICTFFFKCLMPIFLICIFFLLLSLESSLYVLDTNLLLGIWLANILSQYICYLFILLTHFFAKQKLILMRPNLAGFFSSILDGGFGVWNKLKMLLGPCLILHALVHAPLFLMGSRILLQDVSMFSHLSLGTA